MTGKLDEISRAIGSIEARLSGIEYRMDDNRELANDRHKENIDNMQQIDGRVESLERSVSPIVKTVADWKPIIDGVLQSKWKRAGAISFVAGLGYVIFFVVDKLGGYILSFLHMKP